MADVIWPVGLPQAPQVAQYSQKDQGRVVRTSMDVGPAMVRLRATAAVEICEIELKLTRTQLATFKAFFRDSAAAGAVPFEWKHHETGNPIDYRFVGEPTSRALAPRQAGGEYWAVTCQLETLPGTERITPPSPPPPPPPAPADPAFVFDEPSPPGPNAELEVMLLAEAVWYFDEPDTSVPAADDEPLIFVAEVGTEDPLLPSILGDTEAPSPIDPVAEGTASAPAVGNGSS